MIDKKKVVELKLDRNIEELYSYVFRELEVGRMTIAEAREITGRPFRWAGLGGDPPSDKLLIITHESRGWEWRKVDDTSTKR